VDVIGDKLSINVENESVFTRKLTYYLSEGCPGLSVPAVRGIGDLPEHVAPGS
jgi:hypothetical protein